MNYYCYYMIVFRQCTTLFWKTGFVCLFDMSKLRTRNSGSVCIYDCILINYMRKCYRYVSVTCLPVC